MNEMYVLKLASIDEAKKVMSNQKKELSDLDVEIGPITENDFIAYAKSIVQPAFTKYQLLFEKMMIYTVQDKHF